MRLEEFRHHAAEGTMVPVYRRLSADALTPVTAFLRLRGAGDAAFLFESVEGGDRIGRYSFLGREPFLRISATGTRVTIDRGTGEPVTREENFFDVLEENLAPYRSAPVPGLPPLTGGAVGYLGYDSIRCIERIPDRHPRETGLADADLRFFDTLIAFDHAKHIVFLIANAHVRPDFSGVRLEAAYAEAVERLDALEETLCRPTPGEQRPRRIESLAPGAIEEGMRSNRTRQEYEAAVERGREYIFAGDIFQVVLSQRFQRKTDVDPFKVYRALRQLNPSPYLFFLDSSDTVLVGSSPEIMVTVQGERALVRPIAGTRRRGQNRAEDELLEKELLGDEKELAEHRMLVDLGRNDIGRVARFGSVELPALEVVERYSHVMHIVSQVTGRLRPGQSAIDTFRACFPAGTVSGAPKIRAMEIIDELETTRRGIYAGAVGYIDFAGNLDTCIAIRTMQFQDGVATVQAGAGIVADSRPDREYRETIDKASALYDAIRLAEAGDEGGDE